MDRRRRNRNARLARGESAKSVWHAQLQPEQLGSQQERSRALFLRLSEGASSRHQQGNLIMTRGIFDLTGKVVLATGANSGIGLGFLQGCAKQGADVAVWGRRADKNAEAVEALKGLGAPRAHAEEVDVSDEAAVEAAFASTLKAMGRVDCAFANAGFSDRAPSIMELTSERYHALLNVNLHGAFYTLRTAARHMKDRADAGDSGGSLV